MQTFIAKALKYAANIIRTAVMIFIITAALSMIYSYITQGRLFSLFYTWCFAVGAFVALAGLILYMFPVILMRKDKFLDHSTIGSNLMEVRERKRKTAYEIMYTGMVVIAITGVIQWVGHYI